MSSLSPIHFILILLGISCVISVIAFCATYLKDYPAKAAHYILDKVFTVIAIFTGEGEHASQQKSKEPVALAKEQIMLENFEKAVLILSEYLKDHPLDKEAQELFERAVKWS